jgi:hypothetical protein
METPFTEHEEYSVFYDTYPYSDGGSLTCPTGDGALKREAFSRVALSLATTSALPRLLSTPWLGLQKPSGACETLARLVNQ